AHVVAPLAQFDLPFDGVVDPSGFGVDRALLAQRLPGTRNPLGLLCGPAALARCGRPTRITQLRKQVVPCGRGAVLAPGRRSPHDGAIRQLFIAPAARSTVESLEPVMLPAI